MRRTIVLVALCAATLAIAACSSSTAPSSAKKPGVKSADIVTDSFPSSTCRSGWQNSSGRCL